MRRMLPFAALATFTTGVGAQTETADTLETLVVTATRTEREIDLVPATVTAISAEDIERELARDIRDLIRYEPGISVGGTGSRFGLGGFTIRGIGGNRVLTTIDGVRVADAYDFGPFLNANRDYVDIDGLRAVEIVRGPASALYGSDALGGVVAYRTKDARDYLDGAPFYAGFKTGYSSVDDEALGTITLAGGGDAVSAVLLYTRREGRETENFGGVGGTGPTRELPDPVDRDSDNVLFKLSLRPSERHSVTLGADSLDSRSVTQVLSDYGELIGTTRTLTSDADDTAERQRVSLDYEFASDGGAFDRISAGLYRQTSEQLQQTRQQRQSLTSGLLTQRRRDSFFDQDIDGLHVQADKLLAGKRAEHYFVVGAEYWTTESASLRNGGTVIAATGAPLPQAEPLPLPTRDFPPTSVNESGVYLQDEIALLGERLRLTPSVRFDSYDATATADAIYLAGNPGTPPPESFDDSEVSPKLGLLYRITDLVSLYAQYAEGFRAPPYDDVNVGFTFPAFGYKTIANPDLESERSRSNELGVRLHGDFGRIAIVAFNNRYDDFIESLLPAAQFAATGGIDPADGLLTFQSQNLENVEIDGFEMSGDFDLGDRLNLHVSLAEAKGTDEATGAPLNSIDPAKAVIGLGYAAPSDRWGGDVVWTLVDAKDADEVDGNRLATAGYGLVDVHGFRRFGERTQLNFGLFNLGDKRYIEWADTAAIAFSSAMGTYPEAARFTHPGFNAGVTVRVELR